MVKLKIRPKPFELDREPSKLTTFVTTGTVGQDDTARAVSAILDTLAVMIAGGTEPGVQKLAASLDPVDHDRAAVRSFWSNARYRSDDAALLFGMASHVLDYDDVCMLAVCHPSVPVLSALLAGADWRTTSGPQLLEAFLVGTEVAIRLGQAMGFRHYELGFHATGTLGTIGATAALARLRGLDATDVQHAFAIAASLSSGLRVNFGSLTKSLHVGIAASNGVRAVNLARAGIEGATEAFDGNAGFLHAFTGGTIAAWPENVKLGEPFAIEQPGFEQKRYPCCYMLHKMIEATLGLRHDEKLDLDSVASVEVKVVQGGSSALIHPYPKNGLNALFSAPYAILACLADGKIDLSSFTDAAVMRSHLQNRLRSVSVIEEGKLSRVGGDVGSAPVTVTVITTQGQSMSRTIRVSPGSIDDPITPEQLRAKWSDCLRRAQVDVTSQVANELFDDGLAIPAMRDIGTWLRRSATVVGKSEP